MTKEHYYEMCKVLNSQPVASEIPIEMEDFPEVAQIAFSIYDTLDDQREYMAGNYIGKAKDTIFELFKLYDIPTEEHLVMYKIIQVIDRERKILINSKNS